MGRGISVVARHKRISHLLKHYLLPYKWMVVAATVALLFTSFSVLALGKGLSFLVDEGLGKQNKEVLDQSLIILISVVCVLAVGTFCRFFFVTYVGERAVADIRRDLYSHMLTLSPEFYEQHKIGDLLSRMTTDTTMLQSVIGSSISVALRNIILFFGGSILLIHSSPKLTAIVAVVVPIVVVPIIMLGKRVRILSKQAQEKVSVLSSHTEESLNGMTTIQSFVREGLERNIFEKHIKDFLSAARQRIWMRSLLTAIVILLIFSAVGAVLWVGGNDVLSNEMSGGELSSFIFYSIVVAGATGALSEVVGELQRAAGALERIQEFFNIEATIRDDLRAKPLSADISGNVEFSKVDFNYPSKADIRALSEVSFSVEAGKSLAIVGPSGSGKSTLFKLLLRFYDINKGVISIDGQDIRNITVESLRDTIGLVPQDPIIFSDTAFANIAFARPEAAEEEVIAAAKAAAAHDFITSLPSGYHTYLGERGVRLSGGEKQRIAIARVLLKNPHILLLDEATSALDSSNEQRVQQALEVVMKGRTTLIIAHRLSTVQKADHIVVLSDGAIKEQGTHAELIKQKGLYHELANRQFSAVGEGS